MTLGLDWNSYGLSTVGFVKYAVLCVSNLKTKKPYVSVHCRDIFYYLFALLDLSASANAFCDNGDIKTESHGRGQGCFLWQKADV